MIIIYCPSADASPCHNPNFRFNRASCCLLHLYDRNTSMLYCKMHCTYSTCGSRHPDMEVRIVVTNHHGGVLSHHAQVLSHYPEVLSHYAGVLSHHAELLSHVVRVHSASMQDIKPPRLLYARKFASACRFYRCTTFIYTCRHNHIRAHPSIPSDNGYIYIHIYKI